MKAAEGTESTEQGALTPAVDQAAAPLENALKRISQ